MVVTPISDRVNRVRNCCKWPDNSSPLPPSVTLLVKLLMRQDACRKKDREAKQNARKSIPAQNIYLYKAEKWTSCICTLIHLKHFSARGSNYSVLLFPVKVDHFCEPRNILHGKSAAEHLMIVIRLDVLVTNQLAMRRPWQVHFFAGEALLLDVFFSKPKVL